MTQAPVLRAASCTLLSWGSLHTTQHPLPGRTKAQGKSTSIMLKKEYRLWYLPICNCQVTHCCSALARSLRKKRAVARKNIPPRTTTNGQSMSAYPKLRNSQSGDSFVLCRIRSEIYKRRAKKISHLDENRHYNVEGTELPKQPPTEHMHAVQNGRLCSEEAECPLCML